MAKKDLYLSPQAEVLDLSYADPVCQAVSTTGLPDYDYLDGSSIFTWDTL